MKTGTHYYTFFFKRAQSFFQNGFCPILYFHTELSVVGGCGSVGRAGRLVIASSNPGSP